MAWKDLPTWIKFGIVFAILDLACFLIILLPPILNDPYSESFFIGWVLTHLPLSYLQGLFGFTSPPKIFELISVSIIGVINWFLIGSLIGLIVDKIKSKKK